MSSPPADGRAQPAEETHAPTLSDPATEAGGWEAIAASLGQAARAGLLKAGRALLRVNQAGGVDCPGCAWPEPEGHHPLEFCENGVKAVASETTSRGIGAAFFAEWSVEALSRKSDQWLNEQGRLAEPMVRRMGATHYTPIGWEDAFALIAETLRGLGSPDEAVFYTSGRTSNEAAFLYQLFVRAFGTNNLPDCSNLCHESSGWALRETIGVGKGTVQLSDFEAADAIFVIGQNPGTNHPRMLRTLQDAARRGCAIVSVNPLPEAALSRFRHPQELVGLLGPGTPIAQLHLPVRVGGDAALFKGMMKELLEREERAPGTALDNRFIADHTDGFPALAASLRAVGWEAITGGSGLTRRQISEAVEILAGSRRTIYCWAMGLTQHRHAVAGIQELVSLALLRGDVGKPGAGLCPVRGHSNVQGDRTMGISERMDEEFLDRLGARFQFQPPRKPGYDTVGAIAALLDGRAHVFFGLGGNFLAASPDTEATARGLRNSRLSVQVSTKLNRGHLVTGTQALILPCLGRTESDLQASGEQFVTVEDSMGVVHSSRGTLTPISSGARSEPAIVAGLARAVLADRVSVPWAALAEDYDRIRDAISTVVPGFEDFNRRVRVPGGFVLPNGARERRFATVVGRARFLVHPLPCQELRPGELLMTTLRSHDQFNTTIYGSDDRYRGVRGGRRVVFMNASDVEERGLRPGQRVDLRGRFEGEERVARGFVVAVYPIPKGCAATYFPEANVLVPLTSVAEKSRTPASKSVAITVHAQE